VKGKPWHINKEQKLRALVVSGVDVDKVAAALGKSRDAILKKADSVGLEVVGAKGYTTTTIPMPKDLPSVEEALRMLADALKTTCKLCLDKVEAQRLQVMATPARTYKEASS
jgi:biotin operon repressor